MADTKISALTEDTAPALADDFLVTADTSATASKKVRPSTILGPTPNAQTGTTYTYAATDAFKTVTLSNAAAIAVTIPTNTAIPFPIGTKIRNYRLGAGLPTIAPDVGVTLRLPTGIRPNRSMRVLVEKSVDQTSADFTVAAAIAYNQESYDTDGFHDNATENTKLIIPAGLGIKQVRLTANIRMANVTTTVYIGSSILKDGSGAFDGKIEQQTHAISGGPASNASGLIDCTDGSYFQHFLVVGTDNSTDITATRTSFGLTVEEINPVGTIAYQYGFVTIEKIGTNEWIMYGPALG